LVPLTREQERETVVLLAELLLDAAARKRRVVSSPAALGGVSGGATGSVIPFPERRGDGREAACCGSQATPTNKGRCVVLECRGALRA